MIVLCRSEEVKKELPEDTARFAGIDTDVKRVLTDFFADKNAAIAYTPNPTPYTLHPHPTPKQ